MKKSVFWLPAFLLLFAYACQEPLVKSGLDEESVMMKSASVTPQSYIVVLQDNQLDLELSTLKGYDKKQEAMQRASANVLNHAGVVGGIVTHVYGSTLHGFSVMLPPGQLKKLENDPSVRYVEEDQVGILISPAKGRPGGGGGGGTTQPSQSTPWGISRVGGSGDGTGKTAWIIDTGIDFTHPDLNVDKSRSADFTGSRNGALDENGHGTHVAGTIAAIDNTIGVVGVAAGATVVAVRVLDRRGSGSYSGVIAGVDYVASNGKAGDVANMSLGGPVSQALDDAVVAAAATGVKFAIAAGNDGANANNSSPARANGANIYTVSAMDSNDNWASFSNYGNPPVDFCAPGVSILSLWKDGGYNTISGTSMATPHLAGVLLLGVVNNSGFVNGDPDNQPDPIIHR